MKKKVLVVGGGGREHALAWKLLQSPQVERVYLAPGNGGTATMENAKNIAIGPLNFAELIRFAKENDVYLTVVGQDAPLALGIVDTFEWNGLRIFGPTIGAARIEWSKSFAKNVLSEQGVATAHAVSFTSYEKALDFIRQHSAPIVVKADGLALGKGVFVCSTLDEVENALGQLMINKSFGQAGRIVVVEEFLAGRELSLHAFCGKDGAIAMFPFALQDHKPIFAGNRGPNTGGMGTHAPVSGLAKGFLKEAEERIVRLILTGLEKRGAPFVGCLYPGLMLTSDGAKVLEVNARFGDTEAESAMRLLKSDLFEIIEACLDGSLSELTIEWDKGCVVCVVMAAKGYPGSYEKGDPISGISDAETIPGVTVFHSGTALSEGRLVTNGGRVLAVTAKAETMRLARTRVYAAVGLIHFSGEQHRPDIAAEAESD